MTQIHSAVYLWAGTATIDLQRTKFPDVPVDTDAHMYAHSREAAAELARCGIKLAFLSMNWGFPSEIEWRHWQEFAEATQAYRAHGIDVVAYVQASNCVCIGSYMERDWYAVDPHGYYVPYFPNRMMTCWNSAEWIANVEEHAVRALKFGAHGVFFDNLWMGATPWTYNNKVAGFAGCACGTCRKLFHDTTGFDIPVRLRGDAASDAYLAWRAAIVHARLSRWRQTIQSHDPAALVMVNNCDVVLRNTRAMFGLDPAQLAPLQDAILIENVALPRVNGSRLVANALPLKALQALAPGKPILSVAYERGIGLDGPPAPARIRRFIAEVSAVGATPVLKGSEYLDDRKHFSVLTAPAFQHVRDAAGELLNWLHERPVLLMDRTRLPHVHVPIHSEAGWMHGMGPALVSAMGLLRAQIPFEFTVMQGKTPEPGSSNGRYASRMVGGMLDPFMRRLTRTYFASAPVRRWVDRTGLTARFLQSPFFDVPAGWRDIWRTHNPAPPFARSEQPILVERWRTASGQTTLHIVNYSEAPVVVEVTGTGGALELHTPDGETKWLDAASGQLRLRCYAIVAC